MIPQSEIERVPKRIQRKRTKGWRIGAAIYVGRGTMWGNPFRVGENGVMSAADAVSAYRKMLLAGAYRRNFLWRLRGQDLACWCPLVDKAGNPVPCHADVLLELANDPR